MRRALAVLAVSVAVSVGLAQWTMTGAEAQGMRSNCVPSGACSVSTLTTTGAVTVDSAATRNALTLAGAATTAAPTITATGVDTNVGIALVAKGAGTYMFGAGGGVATISNTNGSYTVQTTSGTVASRRFRLAPNALDTCGSTLEGETQVDVLSGAATGVKTRVCMCLSATGASDWKWFNLLDPTITTGTTTTCPN